MDSDPTESPPSTRRPAGTPPTCGGSTDDAQLSDDVRPAGPDDDRRTTFRVRALDAPTRAQVGEKIGVVVTVRNDGDRTATYGDAVVVADGPGSPSKEFAVPDVPPGELRKRVVGVSIDAVGDVLLGLRDAGLTSRVVVGGAYPGAGGRTERRD